MARDLRPLPIRRNNAVTSSIRPAVVVGANRIPFARAGGRYAASSNKDMLTAALEGLVARFGLAGERLDEVSAGAVLKHSRDFNLTREVVLGSSLDPHTPAYDVQRACATGLEAIVGVSNKIALGQVEVGVGGGVDSASDAPIVVSDRLRRTILRASRAKSLPERLKVLAAIRPRDLAPVAPDTAEPRTGLSMGQHQAITTERWGITREQQDELALRSHQNLAAAYDRGFFDDLLTPYRGVTRDEFLRADTSMEKLGTLRTAFTAPGSDNPTMTAGNSTPLSDGASAVLLATEEWAAERGLPALARVVDAQTAAVDFTSGAEGLLMGGCYAVPRLLERHGLTLEDFDFVEIHEAFAGTVLSTLAAWNDTEFCRERLGRGPLGTVASDRLNVTGSSLAAGHPFGATGGRIVGTLAKLLAEKKAATGAPVRGLISVCAAGGQATAMILEA
ncbi:acetyl-CoA C-acetyltransferase [Georgenia satyanarayanai]|uniref:acetyl-CoA C-acetyltransferase n=1 Tax=Georgenia satyanarayanai TaxID=860221 RepID=UPI002040F145|nr:acetyl-CoA C-acetyltransferase [Georgenia satyanarayanai]MCM3660338.1 acetyl-CoA C-acetyltransferase [Georgenia satyanarayanai]